MKKSLLTWILFSAGCWAQQPPAKDRIVILISIDGFPSYMLDVARLPVPNLRKLMLEGAGAKRMIPVNPTVTWPNHTSMVTGAPPATHGVLFNGMLMRDPIRVEPWRDKAEMVQAPTIYDVAHRNGLTTAEVDWVAIQNPGTVNWSFGERPKAADAIPREMIEAGLVSESDILEFAKSSITWRDLLWTRAASHIIEKHRPNLLMVHLLNTDSSHHRYGPRSLAGNSALALADARVGDILRSIDKAGLRGRATILIVSDHGFKAVKKHIAPNAALRAEGLLQVNAAGKPSGDAWAVSEGGTAMIYATNRETRTRLLPRLKEMFTKLEGVDRVIDQTEFLQLGMPLPERNPQMADLVLSAKDGYAFSGAVEGDSIRTLPETGGSHGYLASDPEMHAIFIAWGRGIRRGARVDTVRTIDVAPTIARLLDLSMPGTAGSALEQILTPP